MRNVLDPDGRSAPGADAGGTQFGGDTMKAIHRIDSFEGKVRFTLGVALLLIAWDYGWTVIGTGAVGLGVISLATAFGGVSLIRRPGSTSTSA
jgi:hypothetical protein